MLRDTRSLIIFNFNKRLLELTHLPFPIFFLGLMLDSIPSPTGRFDGSLKEPPSESSAAAARFRLHCRNRAPRPPGAGSTAGIERRGRRGADPTAGIERHGKLERAPHGGSWADLQGAAWSATWGRSTPNPPLALRLPPLSIIFLSLSNEDSISLSRCRLVRDSHGPVLTRAGARRALPPPRMGSSCGQAWLRCARAPAMAAARVYLSYMIVL